MARAIHVQDVNPSWCVVRFSTAHPIQRVSQPPTYARNFSESCHDTAEADGVVVVVTVATVVVTGGGTAGGATVDTVGTAGGGVGGAVMSGTKA